MREVISARSNRSYEKTVRIIAIITIATGILVMYAWIFDIDVLKSIFPNAPSMKFNTALSFTMSGVSLYFITRIREGNLAKAHLVLPGTSIVIFLLMVSIIVSIFLRVESGIETVFVEEKSLVLTISPGQPSLATIASFAMIVVLSVSALYSSSILTRLSTRLGLAILIIGIVSLVGYVIGLPVLYYYVEGISTGMAPNTGALFVLLGSSFVLLGASKETKPIQLKSGRLSKKIVGVLLIVSIIPIIIVLILFYATTQNYLLLDAQESINIQAVETSYAIKLNHDLRKQQIEILATRNVIQDLLAEYTKKESGSITNEQVIQDLKEKLRKDLIEFQRVTAYELTATSVLGFYEIDVVDKNGLVIYSTDKSSEGTDLFSTLTFKSSLQGSHFWYEFDDKRQIPSIILVSPVLDTIDGQVVGVIITKKGTETTDEILKRVNEIGSTRESYLVNRDGLMITGSRFVENASYNVKVNTVPVKECFENNNSFEGYYENYRGITVYGASICNTIPDYVLITEVDKKEILLPVTDVRDYTIVLVTTLVGLIVAIGIIITRSIIDPIKKLALVVERIGAGDLNAQVESSGDDEISQFSTTLNKTTYSLKSAREELLRSEQIIKDQLEQLKEADIGKDEFASMVTHELKTPLTPIKGRCEMLLEAGVLGQLTPAQEQSIHIIYNSATRLERLISDVLDAQKIDMNRMKFNKDKIEIKKFMEDISRDHLPLINEKEITFLNTTTSNSTIVSDEGRLTQVMTNLIRNAVDFVQPKTGLINIAATDKDSNVVFYVKDNGTGIPKEQQANLFKKFFQIDTSARRKHGGTGLGLVICKGILEAQAGKIWFESEEGKGTTFYFSMPKDDDSKVI